MPLVAVVVIAGIAVLAIWEATALAKKNVQPVAPPAAPPAPTPGVITIVPGSAGTTPAKVGDSIVIQGIAPYTPQNPGGFAVYASPSVVSQANATTFVITAPGTIHVAWQGGEVFVAAT